MADIKGIFIEIGGETTQLQKAMDEVVKKGRDIDKELRAVNAQLKFDPKNTELIAQKQRLLGEAIANTKAKLDTLREADRQAKAQLDSGDLGQDEYDALRREVIKTENQLKGFETQLKNTGKAGEELAKKLDRAGQKLQGWGKNLSTKVTAPLVGIGAAGFKMAAELEDALGATDQIFKGSSGEVKAWAESLETYYGIAQGEAHEYANMMGAMLQNIGNLTEEEAAKQAQTLIELAGDLSAMFGGSVEDAVRALTGALKGNNTMLDNYGMGVNEATIKTKALEMGLYDGIGQMDLATKQAATLALIMEQTADAQGQAAREADGASGSMKALWAELKNLSTEIGEVLLPILTPMIQNIKDTISKFGEMDEGTKKLIVQIGIFAAVLGPLLIMLGKVATGVSALIKVFGVLKGSAAIGGATTAISGAGGLTAATTGLGLKFTALAAAGGPILAVVAGLGILYLALKEGKSETSAATSSIAGDWQDMARDAGIAVNGIAKETEDSFSRAYQAAYDRSKEIEGATISAMHQAVQAVKKGRDNMQNEMSKLSWRIPTPNIPKFNLKGNFDFATKSVPEIVTWYDKGGIFTSPSIIGVGEKRPEFVGALDDLKKIVADVIDQRQGPGITIQNMSVREEADIQKIARELDKLRRRS